MSKAGDLFCMTMMLLVSVLWFETMMSFLFYQAPKAKPLVEKNDSSSQDSSTKSLTYYIPFDGPDNNPLYLVDETPFQSWNHNKETKIQEAISHPFSRVASLKPVMSSSPVPYAHVQKRQNSVSKGMGKSPTKARPTPLTQPDKNSKKHQSSS
jgi:hypothetical protein